MGEEKSPGRRRMARRKSGRAIVDAIVEATERLITESGMDGLTTARIAEVSGVSVGSIYQYFESKEAILGELARRIEVRAAEHFVAAMGEASDLGTQIKRAVDTLREPGMGDLSMRRLVRQHVPAAWIERSEHQTDSKVEGLVRTMLEQHAAEVREGDLDLMAFVVTKTVEQVIEAAVRDRPELVEDPAFGRELEHLIAAYLRPASG